MDIKILDFQTEGELSIVQFATMQQNTFEYISLGTAISKELLEIREIDQAADVNNLIVLNKSDKYVFIMDGDILEGAKQNRVVNTSVLLSPNKKTILPVSCIEQGRWRFVSDKFKHSDYVAPSKMRGSKASSVRKSLRENSGYDANQSEVWKNVNSYQKDFSYYSETSNFSDAYKHKSNDVKSLIEKFEVNKKANGIAVFLKKNLLSIDVFNRTEIYAEYFTKILKGVAFEASQLKPTNHGLTSAEASYKTQDFFDNIEKLKYNEFDGVGVGTEYRFEDNEFTGFTLKYKNHVIHLVGLNVSRT